MMGKLIDDRSKWAVSLHTHSHTQTDSTCRLDIDHHHHQHCLSVMGQLDRLMTTVAHWKTHKKAITGDDERITGGKEDRASNADVFSWTVH